MLGKQWILWECRDFNQAGFSRASEAVKLTHLWLLRAVGEAAGGEARCAASLEQGL